MRALLLIFTLMALLSCREQADSTKAKQETPQALQDETLSLKSYGRSSGRDLTEELYEELVDNSPTLKKLEDDMVAFNATTQRVKETFSDYNGKSTSYYSSASSHATTLRNSLLRKKILAFIRASESRYNGKTEALTSLLQQVSQNSLDLNDQHTVLKLILTLPIIEKYQIQSFPTNAKEELQNLIQGQQRMIHRIDSITPKF